MSRSNQGKSDAQRLADLKASRKKFGAKKTVTLRECAAIWGVSKSRFVNKRADFESWPEPVGKEGNADLFDGRAAYGAMIAYLERTAKQSLARAKRMQELTGAPDQMAAEIAGGLSIAEIATANRIRADMEAAAREQGEFIPVDEVSATAGVVFSMMSEFMSDLSNQIDPHGKLEPNVRAQIDRAGEEKLLDLHARMKAYLTDANQPGTGTPARKPRKPRARRKRS